MAAVTDKTPEEKAKSKRAHRIVMLACGGWMVASGIAAAFLAYAKSSGFTFFLRPLSSFRRPSAPRYHLPIAAPPYDSVGTGIEWRSWREPGAGDKLILLNVSASWSHPCRLMDELTYKDPKVIRWVRENVIAVGVDVDERPDIAKRYITSGLPATAMLLPSGEVISDSAFSPPERFLPWAEQVAAAFQKNPSAIFNERDYARRHAAELKAELSKPPSLPVKPRDILERHLRAFTERFDEKDGGFRPGPKSLSPELLGLLMDYSASSNDLRALNMALKTLDGASELIDPAAGGMFRDSLSPDWRFPEYEKRLDVQADAVRLYAKAFAAAHNDAYRLAAGRIVDFVEGNLGLKNGVYSSGLDSDLQLPSGGWIEGNEYYRWDLDQRRKVGLPRKDPAAYVEPNAKLAAAYLQAASAFRRPELRIKGLELLKRIENLLRSRAGWIGDDLALADAELSAIESGGKEGRLRSVLLKIKSAAGRDDPETAARAAILFYRAGRILHDSKLKAQADEWADFALAHESWIPPAIAARAAFERL